MLKLKYIAVNEITMEAGEIIGYVAALLITAANFPQAYVIIRDKSAATISPTTYFILLSGTLLWVVYGIIKDDWPIVIANSISATTSLIILILNFISSKTINKIHKAIIPAKIRKQQSKSPRKSPKV